MNYSVVRYILGWVMLIEAAFMSIPCVTALIYGEEQGFAFLGVMLGSALLGGIIILFKPKRVNFYLREGFVTVALSWIVLSVIGCLPFVINGDIPNFVDALFETISGFTTTGATVLGDVESLAKCSLLWRSFTHWIGGMGVLVFLLAVLPLAGGSNMNLMKAESPGPAVGKLVPKVKQTAMILYAIYIVLTIIEIIFLLIGGMPLFDSLATAFGTAGTGGLGIKNDSMMSYSPYLQWVVAIFMIIFGVNFNVYFFIIMGKFSLALKHEEARTYLIIIATSIAVITANIYHMVGSFGESLRHATFQVASLISSTGYASIDFDLWPSLSKTVLLLVMLVGACAGSTGGGIKVSRFIIMAKTFIKEITTYLHPRSVKKIKLEGKLVEHETVRSINVYFITFIMLFGASVLLVSLEGKDLVTNFTAVLATINNMGPGFALVGPTRNFGFFNSFTKLVLMFDMLAGRLELFPMLLLFCPGIWKRRRKVK